MLCWQKELRMKLTPELKSRIDSKSYTQLIEGSRYHPNSNMFEGESKRYWFKRAKQLLPKYLPGQKMLEYGDPD